MVGILFRPPPGQSPLLGISSTPVSVGLDALAHHHPATQVSAVGRSTADLPVKRGWSWHSYIVPLPIMRLWPRGEDAVTAEAVLEIETAKEEAALGIEAGNAEKIAKVEEAVDEREDDDEEKADIAMARQGRRGNWLMNILLVGSILGRKGRNGDGREAAVLEAEEREKNEGSGSLADGDGRNDDKMDEGDRCIGCRDGDEEEGCPVGEGSDGHSNQVEFDKESFSSLLRRVSLAEVVVYDQLSYLGSLAYSIPKIKPAKLLKDHGLRFVVSSLAKKSKSTDPDTVSNNNSQDQTSASDKEIASSSENSRRTRISASAAYQIAASAASYLHSQTKGILALRSGKGDPGSDSTSQETRGSLDAGATNRQEASFVATTNSVTAVVAAEEHVKEAVAKDLNSSQSSPCEWFICEDDANATRYFVIQGSETLASWKANLLFEPIQFEGLDVLVHRGIYEAAKGIYEQMLPEVRAHLESRGDLARLRFTGHSLGGSLSLLVNLMLLIRGEVPASALLPVITFGAPSIMCGGNYLLRKLGLPHDHVQAVTMHRDIVPRAFSCNYPDHVAQILKAVNRNFRNHPCLNNQKFLYEPMGEILILQPDEKFSPHHHLLPSGSGLYILGDTLEDSVDSRKLLRAACSVFLNSPHPLEILSDRAAFGSEGTVTRDHDMTAYQRTVRGVITMELSRLRKAERERRRQAWSALLAPEGLNSGIVTNRRSRARNPSTQQPIGFSSVFQGGKDSLKRFGRLVASQHVHMLFVLFIPARLLIIKALAVVSLS